MAEESIGTTLVKNTPREKLVLKLNSFKVSNMTAKERNEYEWLALYFARSFRVCAYSFLGVSKSQLAGLTDSELIDCSKLLYDRIKWRVLFYKIGFGIIPIVGWLCLLVGTYDPICDCSPLYYSNKYKQLQAKPFPIEIVRRELL